MKSTLWYIRGKLLLLSIFFCNIPVEALRVMPSPFKSDWNALVDTLKKVSDRFPKKFRNSSDINEINARIAYEVYRQMKDLNNFFHRYLYSYIMNDQIDIDIMRAMQQEAQSIFQKKNPSDIFLKLVKLMKNMAKLSINYASSRRMSESDALQWVHDFVMETRGFTAAFKKMPLAKVTQAINNEVIKTILKDIPGVNVDNLHFAI